MLLDSHAILESVKFEPLGVLIPKLRVERDCPLGCMGSVWVIFPVSPREDRSGLTGAAGLCCGKRFNLKLAESTETSCEAGRPCGRWAGLRTWGSYRPGAIAI